MVPSGALFAIFILGPNLDIIICQADPCFLASNISDFNEDDQFTNRVKAFTTID